MRSLRPPEYVFFFLSICLFIYLWLCWVFVSVRGLSLVAASGGHSSSWCAGLSLLRPLLLWSTGSRRAGSVVEAHGLSCSAACGIFPDRGSNLCPLHWQADSQPLRHQGSPRLFLLLNLSLTTLNYFENKWNKIWDSQNKRSKAFCLSFCTAQIIISFENGVSFIFIHEYRKFLIFQGLG